eukprot:scaffold11144_cov111-Isochrysis_galbana.AAC.1
MLVSTQLPGAIPSSHRHPLAPRSLNNQAGEPRQLGSARPSRPSEPPNRTRLSSFDRTSVRIYEPRLRVNCRSTSRRGRVMVSGAAAQARRPRPGIKTTRRLTSRGARVSEEWRRATAGRAGW